MESQTMSEMGVSTTPATTNGASGGLTFAEVENYWIQAGGNPQAAAMAAAVADASSGLNPSSSRTNPDGSESIGLWLLPKNGVPPGTTDPVANARAAIQLSQNGTDWSQWCVTWSDNNCGEDNGTYLGDGSNALASLAQRLSPASYNVIGSTPSGSGTGASSATAPSTTTGGTTSKSKELIIVIALVLILILVWYFMRQSKSQGTAPIASETDTTNEE